jgi:hypothetical protein
MKQAYPVIITKDKDFFVASIPDFETGTQGESLAEAIEMARDAIGMCGCYMQDEKKEIPIPTDIGNVTKEASDILTLVDVDFDEYRKKHEMRTVRKNVTIPSWLNEEAESANINFSALLQKAIKAELHLL